MPLGNIDRLLVVAFRQPPVAPALARHFSHGLFKATGPVSLRADKTACVSEEATKSALMS